jgi:hypothetical protein
MPYDKMGNPINPPAARAAAPETFSSILGSSMLSREAKRARLKGLLGGAQGGAQKKALEAYLTQFKLDPFEVSKGTTRTWQIAAPANWRGGGRDKQGNPLPVNFNNDNSGLLAEGALAISPERWAAILGGGADPLVGPGFKGQDVPKTVFGQERNPIWQQGANDFNSILSNPSLSLYSKQAKLNGILGGGKGAELKRFLNRLLSEMGQSPVNSFDTNAFVNAALRVSPDMWAKTLSPYASGTWQEFQYK